MTLVIIFGPPAVGKMTVGLELEKLTGLPLFHNHMTVDPVIRLFPFGSPAYARLVMEFRQRIFEELAATDATGLIFTFVWALDDASDRMFINRTIKTFTERGADICFVELEATQAERLRRNETPLRLAEKRPQRDTPRSRAFILDADRRYQLNTDGSFSYPERHLKIENTELEPKVVAHRIVEHFNLPLQESRPTFRWSSPRDAVEQWVAAFNARDARAAAALYHDDATNWQVAAEDPAVGRQAILEDLLDFFRAFPDSFTRVENLFEDGEWAMLEWFGGGTWRGEFAGASPNGKSYTLRGCGFFRVVSGKIAFQRGYWDRATWFRQLGIPL